MIRFACSHCNHPMKAPDESAGQDTVCRKCQEPLKIPAEALEERTGATGMQIVWALAMLVAWGAAAAAIVAAMNTTNYLERLCILATGGVITLAALVTGQAVDRIGGRR